MNTNITWEKALTARNTVSDYFSDTTKEQVDQTLSGWLPDGVKPAAILRELAVVGLVDKVPASTNAQAVALDVYHAYLSKQADQYRNFTSETLGRLGRRAFEVATGSESTPGYLRLDHPTLLPETAAMREVYLHAVSLGKGGTLVLHTDTSLDPDHERTIASMYSRPLSEWLTYTGPSYAYSELAHVLSQEKGYHVTK